MLFNSFEFLILFLPLTLAIAHALRGNRLLVWMSFSSFVFYAFAGQWWFLIPMAFSTTLDFWTGLRIESSDDPRVRRFYLLLSLTFNLGLLFYFKYAGLFLGTARSILEALGFVGNTPFSIVLASVVLPAGISFYTFQTISYVIDIYRKESHAERNFFKYVSFVAFFPHLVAGPLTRHNQLIPQLTRISKTGPQPRLQAGVYLFVFGLAKKVLIADRVANWIDPVIADIGHARFLSCWIAIVGYAIQIYYDFSGYSDMAVGLGRLFGIELPQNFDSPYKSLNPSDFWRRWHITLSQWLRDYVYISLGGNRSGEIRARRNVMITMLLGGLWHGANWTFVVWGFFHGALLVLYRMFGKRWDRLPALIRQISMFVLVCIGWVFFRAPNFGIARIWLKGLVGLGGGTFGGFSEFSALFIFGAWAFAARAPNLYRVDLEALSPWSEAALGVVAAAAILLMNYSSKFLYFQF